MTSALAHLGTHRDIVVIGASAGGVAALRELVSGLTPDLPAAIFVVVHSTPEFGTKLAELLGRWGPMTARIAVHGERIRPGQIYVCPNDNHMTLHRDFVRVTRGPKENGHRPAVDPLFRTAARMYGNRVVGIVLSGNLSCGTEGLMAVKANGGFAVVQSDPEFPGMPSSALAHVEVDSIVPIAEMAGVLRAVVTEPIAEQAQSEAEGPHLVAPQSSQIVCPSCQGAMMETLENGLLRFRCHVGHAFSVDSLLAEQTESLEAALWASVRALEESAQLADRLASSGDRVLSPRFREKAAALRQHASLIQDVLLHGTTLDAQDMQVLEPRTLES
jgi:two-component system, chemotaxis family, protein-glutamate methylesterase/glutaminase